MKGVRRRDWLETEGTVTGVFKDGGYGEDAIASVVFTYKVNDRWYSGTFAPYKHRYSIGDTLPVRYDPNDPTRNNLVVKDHWHRLIYWAIGAVLMIVTALAILNRH